MVGAGRAAVSFRSSGEPVGADTRRGRRAGSSTGPGRRARAEPVPVERRCSASHGSGWPSTATGVVGKRVADAVALPQDGMELVGVADVAADYRVRVALERAATSLYAAAAERRAGMGAGAGLEVAGATSTRLSAGADLVVDCAPKRVASANRDRYRAAGVKAIWQGGEAHELAGYSFVAQVNYAGALGRDAARVVSCNTTALCRVLGALHARGLVKKARAVLMRRATDPWGVPPGRDDQPRRHRMSVTDRDSCDKDQSMLPE